MGILELGRYKDAVDVVQKLLVGIGLAAVGVYLTVTKDEYEKEKFCYATKVSLLGEAGAKFDRSGVDARIGLMQSLCPGRIDEFTRLLMVTADVPRAAPPPAAPPSDRQPNRGPASIPTDPSVGGEPRPAPSSGAAALQGWVAVMFANPRSYSETNFDLASRTEAGGTTPIAGAVAADTILRARWQVNVRRGAADWREPLGILDVGQCARVKSVTTLSAGERQQIWAEVAKIECDAALAKR